MTTIVCAENVKILQLSSQDIDDRTIHVKELNQIKSDKSGSFNNTTMPADVYNWCLKNDCRYLKAKVIEKRIGDRNGLVPVLIFASADAAKKFRYRWVDTVIQFDNFDNYNNRMTSWNYKFVSKAMDNWYYGPKIKFNRIAYDWMRCNHVKIIKNALDHNIGHFLVFDSPESAMAFKLAWL